jgi:L-aminopeptidase/D-esterase-like protein
MRLERRPATRCLHRSLPRGIAAAVVLLAPPAWSQDLVPDTTVRGPVLAFDFPEVHVGIAEYAEGPTGTTVFYFPEPVKAAIDVRGGAPGVVNSDPLRLHYDAAYTNAVCFSGGSSYGLSAATGVAEAIKEMNEDPGNWNEIAFVPGAIIFDLGGRRLNAITPDAALGKAALRAARPGAFPLGAQGAGRFTMQGWYLGDPQHSGQGGAFRQIGRVKVAVFTVVNPGGAVVDREGNIVRCSRPRCGEIAERLEEQLVRRIPDRDPEAGPEAGAGRTTNTTITLVVTNVKMPVAALQRLAVQVHGSMARAIQPFATQGDGDTLIAATTGQVEVEGLSFRDVGVLASEVAWDAVLASVPELPPPGPTMPVRWSPAELDAVAGTYRFSRWATLRIEREGNALVARGPESDNLYFPSDEPVTLVPVSPDRLMIDRERPYWIRIERDGDLIAGLVLEPGPWGQRATRVTGR